MFNQNLFINICYVIINNLLYMIVNHNALIKVVQLGEKLWRDIGFHIFLHFKNQSFKTFLEIPELVIIRQNKIQRIIRVKYLFSAETCCCFKCDLHCIIITIMHHIFAMIKLKAIAYITLYSCKLLTFHHHLLICPNMMKCIYMSEDKF